MSKTVIITGTSRGIGYEMVKKFAALGHRVIALSRNQKPVLALGLDNTEAFPFDLSNPEHQSGLKEYLAKHDLRVDILINNAGMLVNKPFNEITDADWKQVYEVNVFGVAATIRTVLPFFAKNAHVVTISSMGGVQGSMKFPGLAAYSSAKGAVITLTELLAEEYKDKGISFNVLALGAVQTEMLEEAFPGYQAPVTAAEMAAYIADFALTGNKLYNGKLLQVSNSTP